MQLGTVLSERYKVGERIGIGGMAAVYRAEDMQLGREVAIKIIHESLSDDETFIQQFRNEAHAAANLSHPNIVMVHDIGQWEGRYFMVMELVEGSTLKDIIRDYQSKEAFMPVERMLALSIQICRGLGYAHRSGLVHCDMKPQNILITVDDRAKITDFGISRAVSEATRTTSDIVWGTPQYFSPEQAAGEPPSPASDVYSMGIIMYELLGNDLPFKGENPTAIALKHLQSPPPHIRTLNKKVPPQMAQILHKVLAKEPAGRYRTAGQLQRILETYLKQSQDATSPFIESLMAKNKKTIDLDKTVMPVKREPVRQPKPTRQPENSRPIRANPQPLMDPSGQTATQLPEKHKRELKTQSPPSKKARQFVTPVSETVYNSTLVILGVVAALSLLGLIPLWYYVSTLWAAG